MSAEIQKLTKVVTLLVFYRLQPLDVLESTRKYPQNGAQKVEDYGSKFISDPPSQLHQISRAVLTLPVLVREEFSLSSLTLVFAVWRVFPLSVTNGPVMSRNGNPNETLVDFLPYDITDNLHTLL
ncbi:hypothetical protein TNCV_3858321 [Trichonephila clavipes]|nr:hypothetical protein TNCV_3858321 [Trichonephila clavipes]